MAAEYHGTSSLINYTREGERITQHIPPLPPEGKSEGEEACLLEVRMKAKCAHCGHPIEAALDIGRVALMLGGIGDDERRGE